MVAEISKEEMEHHRLLQGSYRYYARHVLKIKTDDGIVPLTS